MLRERIKRLEFVPALPLTVWGLMYPLYYFTCKTQAVKCTKRRETVEFNEWVIVYISGKKYTFLI